MEMRYLFFGWMCKKNYFQAVNMTFYQSKNGKSKINDRSRPLKPVLYA